MAKRFFHTLSTTLQQHCSRHFRCYRHHPMKNKTHFHHKYSHPSFSPTPNLWSSFKKSEFVAWYLDKLKTNPIITKAVTSSLICAAADLSSQMIRKPASASYALKSTFSDAVYGLLILGPSQHLWFNFLSNILPTRGLVSTLMKTYLNHVFFSYDDNRFQGENMREIIANLFKSGENGPEIIAKLFLPVCDFVTFKFIPVQLQPLMNSSCTYLWTIYCSHMRKGITLYSWEQTIKENNHDG